MRELLLSCILISSVMAGCILDPPEAKPRTDEGPDALTLLPIDHALTLSAELEAGGWVLWLWKNDIPPARREESIPYLHVVTAEPITDSADPFWLGAYSINVEQDPDTGRAIHMSARAQPWVSYVTNEWLASQEGPAGSGQQGGASARRFDAEGILLFSESAVRMTYVTTLGAGAPPQTLEPFATGNDLAVAVPPLHETAVIDPDDTTISAEIRLAPGFVAGHLAYDYTPPPAGWVDFSFTLRFPDGERRIRDFQRMHENFLSERCHPRANPFGPCRESDSGGVSFIDYSNSCQPPGPAGAWINLTYPSPNVRPVPVIFNVPYDYCPLLHADASTPHPCRDMTTNDFQGCPD